ncbi:MAG: cytochrome c [Gammaproteobacteria bacterium]|nr:MAG: cytochrome c [Gammaproteobacteria bacterium]
MNKVLIGGCIVALLLSGNVLARGNPEAGKAKAQVCAGCHGAEGISVAPAFPNLGGQHEDYLLHALKAYKSGARKNPIMQGQVGALTEQDMKNLAAYFASLPGALRDINRQP